MKKILLISDTHSYIDNVIIKYTKWSDEVWHAGDIGSMKIITELKKYSLLRAVHGNIDNNEIKNLYPKDNIFKCEKLNIMMTHIGGYPNKYSSGVTELIEKHKIDIFISGHSHILKVKKDLKYDLIHFNPGASGIYGFHKKRSMIKFEITDNKISNLFVIDLGKK